jgi:hypothetical protein
VRPFARPPAAKRPQGPDRDRVSASAERATRRHVGVSQQETTRSIPLGSTSRSRYSRGSSELLGSGLSGVRRSRTRQGPAARGSADGRGCVARQQRSSSARRDGG